MMNPATNRSVPFWFIFLFAALLWGGQYVQRHLWEPDEARYTYIAQEMAQTGHWLVPQRNGEFYSHKPPLMFWLIQASTLFTGGEFNGVSGRLPSLFGILLSLFVITRLAARWFDPGTAWRALFIVSTSTLFWLKGGTGQIDMLLLGLELTAVYLLFLADEKENNALRAGAFAFMGLAILAKGPVGLIVPTGIYICANLATGDRHRVLRTFWLWGILVSLIFPVAWLVAAWIKGAPDAYFNELLFAQNLGRVKGEFGGHVKPVYYYVQYLLVDFLPWTLFVPISIAALVRQKVFKIPLRRLFGWALFVIIFFSLIKSKRNLYILSVYPAAAMLVAAAVPYFTDMSKKWVLGSIVPLFVLLVAVPIAGIAVFFIPLPLSPVVFLPITLIFGTGVILLFRNYKSNGLSPAWINAFIGVMLVAEFFAGTVVMPAFNPLKTPVQLAAAAQQVLKPNQNLLLYKMEGEIMAFYSKRPGKRVDDPKALMNIMKKTKHGIVVFSVKNWNQLKPRFSRCGSIHYFKMGHKKRCWLEYRVGASYGNTRKGESLKSS